MLILGLDIATTTGFAWYDTDAQSLSSIKSGLIKAETKGYGIPQAESFARALIKMIREQRPDFVAIESPFAFVKEYETEVDTLYGAAKSTTINPDSTNPKALAWLAVGIIGGAYRIPYEMIDQKTWRVSWFGKGFKPPKKAVKDRHGNQKKDRRGNLMFKADWKTPAVERCRALKVEVRNADAAEAVGIAFAGAACQTAKMLQTRSAA